MAETTNISWCDATFNPFIGCTKVSPACDGCYAENLMATRYGRVQWGAPGQGNGTRVRTSASNWAKPVQWNKQMREQRLAWMADGTRGPKPQRFVFCASLADVFDNQVPAGWRRDLFDLIRATPHLTWLLLTKRPGNIVKLWAETFADDSGAPVALTSAFWPRNAAIGCTVVTQEEADRDIPKLLAAKAALNPAFAFVSMEPLLGPVNLNRLHGHQDLPGGGDEHWWESCLDGKRFDIWSEGDVDAPKLDWVIAGGETDQGSHRARPSHPDWFRSLRDQCAAAGTPFHFKQWGEWTPGENAGLPTRPQDCAWWFNGDWDVSRHGKASLDNFTAEDEPDLYRVGKKGAGRLLDGVEHNARPVIA